MPSRRRRRPAAFQPHIGGQVGWHQDASSFVTAPPGLTTFWFALEDAMLDNGCLEVDAGSRRGLRGVLRERDMHADGHRRMEALDTRPWPDMAVAPNRSPNSQWASTLHANDAGAAYSPLNWA